MTARDTVFGIPHSDGHSPERAAFYLNTLKPFTDPDLLKRFLTMPNRILYKNPELRQHIAAAFASDDDQSLTDSVELLDLMRESEVAAKQTPIMAILAHLNLTQELNDIKIEAVGFDSPTLRINAVALLTARLLAGRIPSEQLEQYQLSVGFLSMSLAQQPDLTANQKQFYLAKLASIGEAIDTRINIEGYLDDLPEKDIQPVSKEMVAADDAQIASLFTEARAAQRYGVKVGYKPMEYHPGSLVYNDIQGIIDFTEKVKDKMHPLVTPNIHNYLALVTDTPKTSFDKRIKLDAFKSRYYYGDTSTSGATGLGFSFESRTAMAISHTGQLFNLMLSQPIAETAAERGVYSAYRKIQAEILAGYIDLTTPLEIIHKVKKQPLTPPSPSSTESGTDIVGRLLIPRIKVVQENEGPVTIDTPQREVRLHGVVWHIRQLPPGFHASPEATELARQAHITLRDGETFVRPHVRGNKKLGEVVTHNLVER